PPFRQTFALDGPGRRERARARVPWPPEKKPSRNAAARAGNFHEAVGPKFPLKPFIPLLRPVGNLEWPLAKSPDRFIVSRPGRSRAPVRRARPRPPVRPGGPCAWRWTAGKRPISGAATRGGAEVDEHETEIGDGTPECA